MRTLFALLLLTSTAQAADYTVVSVGRTKLEHRHSDGWWYQDHFGANFDEDSPSWSLRAGWNLSPRWSVEAGYTDLGKMSSAGSYVDDAEFAAGNFTAPHGTCYLQQKAYGFDLSAKYGIEVSGVKPYLRGGLYAYHGVFDVSCLQPDGHINKLGGTDFPDIENRIKPFGGIGIEYRNMTLEYARYPYVGVQWGAVQSAKSVSIGFKF